MQRFELTFELVLKALHSYLQHQGFQSAGPRAAFKTPFAIGLMLNQEEADSWLQMLEDRNLDNPEL
ncbi:MAG: nucleotidyltransferase substrate binding protein [Verrucomicrobia bacterium]|nr:nucleotidyltransferase substrate binding protein [Verrucomicrobiota bacterium]